MSTYNICFERQIKTQLQQNLCKTATLKKTKIGFQYQLSLNAGEKYCSMLQGEHSAILSTFIKLTFGIKMLFVLSIFEWPFYTVFTVHISLESRYLTFESLSWENVLTIIPGSLPLNL